MEQCSSFLIPIIMSKLLAKVQLQIVRVSAKDVWGIEELMKVIKDEVEARGRGKSSDICLEFPKHLFSTRNCYQPGLFYSFVSVV